LRTAAAWCKELRILRAGEKKDLRRLCFVCLLAGDIAMLLTMIASGFGQLIGQYTLLVGLARIPAILLNSWSRVRPRSISSLLLKNRARSSTKDVSCNSFSVALSINSCILGAAEGAKTTDLNSKFSFFRRARPMSYGGFQIRVLLTPLCGTPLPYLKGCDKPYAVITRLSLLPSMFM
jgi:hypothetical protein